MSAEPRYAFLACSERSGSNLITRVMDSHSAFCGPSPTHLFRYLLDYRSRYGDLSVPRNWRLLVEDAVRLFDSKLGTWRAEITAQELDDNVPSRDIRGLGSYVYEKELRLNEKQALFVKENHLWRHMDFFRSAYPEAKYVFFVRDPRDMALSWKKSPNLRGCALRAARMWKRDQAETLRFYRDPEWASDMILIRYEDLLAQPEAELRRLCRFLDVAYEPEMTCLDRNPSAVVDAAAMKEWENLKRPLLAGNAGKFRQGLFDAEIAFVESHCRAEMLSFGYEPVSAEPADEASLAATLQSGELHDKPAYREQPEASRRRHEKRAAVVAGIAARSVQGDPIAMADG